MVPKEPLFVVLFKKYILSDNILIRTCTSQRLSTPTQKDLNKALDTVLISPFTYVEGWASMCYDNACLLIVVLEQYCSHNALNQAYQSRDHDHQWADLIRTLRQTRKM